MKISKKRLAFLIIAVLLACFALAPVYSCGGGSDGDGGNNNNNPADNPGGQTDAEIGNGDSSPDSPAVQEYVYPEDMNGNGAAFKIAAPTTTWFFYTDIVHDEITGEILDDAIYTRNRLIEDKFNINFKETQIEIENFNNQVRKVTAAGDAAYDAAFCPMYRGTGIINMISENIFYNLREIPTMNLEEKWWNQMINKEATLGKGDRLFFAASDINIMTLQCVEAV
ncbi:MAG: hypothetical protein FWD23_14500, partial [Oscillospiraceae bacterium]|nr:hypothetical protein [Oscillospiraceae bacterium]